MHRCALCQAVLPSKLKLVQHFSDAHSIAKQRERRPKGLKVGRYVTSGNVFASLEDHDAVDSPSDPLKSFHCAECENDYATETDLQSHQCIVTGKRQPVACQYCGQVCKDRRGAAIHQAFCENKIKETSALKVMHGSNATVAMLDSSTLDASTVYECPAHDCGAMFKNQDSLVRHIEKHHSGEGISVYRSNTPPSSPFSLPEPSQPLLESTRAQTPPPLVTVTMKPHVGKTEGLQDLSLLINPTKNGDGSPEYTESPLPSSSREPGKDTTSITVEVVNTDSIVGNKEAILYVAEDGTVKTSPGTSQTTEESQNGSRGDKEHLIVISGDEMEKNHDCQPLKCSICRQYFLNKDFLKAHLKNKHSHVKNFSNLSLKRELLSDDSEQSEDSQNFGGDAWEVVPVGKEVAKSEYQCSLCKRHFLSELGCQTHVKNKECKNKKLKLSRMFSCHFSKCDSSFFKLKELQRHWQIAHKFTMASKNLEFDDEKSFTTWLAGEEDKYKVRFTSDVKRRKQHRTERLLVCHRFHNLRAAAARKNSNKEYSDRHNWVHKIKPCLCFARMKVYQEFNEDTCDYTGKISVVYFYEHSHPEDDDSGGSEDILNHILQRNKRNRPVQFQELKGLEKMLHRQKLEKLARLVGKEYHSTVKGKSVYCTKKPKRHLVDETTVNSDEEQMVAVSVANNLLESDELFATQVEMVLDGQFDMGPEVLSGPVVTHLDSLPIFSSGKVERTEDAEGTGRSEVNIGVKEETVEALLPASAADWGKLFDMVRARVSNEENDTLQAEAALVLPYEKVIELISPSEQIPIFRQLWELAYPSSPSREVGQFEMDLV